MWCFMKRLANGSSTTGLAVLFLNIKVQPVKLQLIINISCFLFKQNKFLQQDISLYFQRAHNYSSPEVEQKYLTTS